MTALDYAKLGADTLMNKFTPAELPPKGQFLYHQGVFLSGMEQLYKLSGEARYSNYIRDWLDNYIDKEGRVSGTDVEQFDFMQPVNLCYRLYLEDPEKYPQYKTAIDYFLPFFEKWPCNAQGGYWHKHFYPNQMWLDTLYMAGPYLSLYAKHFDRPYLFERVFTLMDCFRRNMTDPKTGLLCHAWDDSKAAEWADPQTGLSPCFWGRALGWYAVSIQLILELLPKEHPRREALINAGRDVINALLRYQDDKTGLWYQVVDRGDDPANWLETSCSCLFTMAICKAVHSGFLSPSYLRHADKAWEGIKAVVQVRESELIVPKVCIGTCVGDYDFYIKRPTHENDLHGMGAFLLMATAYHEVKG
jgi:unsaturated rhamnogalacturonyl hydrolase